MDEWSRLYHRTDVYGIKLLHAQFTRHAFARHVHDYFVVGLIETGANTFTCRGATHTTPAGGFFVIHPDEAHDGQSATPHGFIYRTLYPSVQLFADIAAELHGRANTVPFFGTMITTDADVARRLHALHGALMHSAVALECETLLLDTFATLIARHSDVRPALRAPQREHAAVQRVREYIEAHYDQPISLAELGQQVAWSAFHMARLFRAQVGLPPHAYLESVRVRHAQRLIALGQPLAEVALATGFAHQSHLNNSFKRIVGVTPGRYAISSRRSANNADGHA